MNIRNTSKSVSAALVIGLVASACSDQLAPNRLLPSEKSPLLPLYGTLISGNKAVSAKERESVRTLARALAASLEEPTIREEFKAAFAGSTIKEQKLHLASFLAGRGQGILAAASRRGWSTHQVQDAIANVRDLEIYMPVDAHRRTWTGSQSIAVVVALTEEEAPEAFDGTGKGRALSRVFAPAEPAIVLAPVETRFGDQIDLNARGLAQRACAPNASESVADAVTRCDAAHHRGSGNPTMSTISEEVAGFYATEIAFANDECGGECWGWGNPEFEMAVYGKRTSNDTYADYFQCAGEQPEIFHNPGHKTNDYWYDQNGQTWAGKVMLLDRSQMWLASSSDSGWVVLFWEDDTDPCRVTHASLGGDGIVWAAAAVAFVPGITNPYAQAVLGVWLGVGVLADILNGGDDFIGIAVHKDRTQFANHPEVIANNNNIVILNHGGQYRGRATMAAYTSTGPYVGPTAAVKLSRAAHAIPLGSSISYSAFAFDAYGTPVPRRAVSWSSSSPSVASIDYAGNVTGNALGTTTITATIDGILASANLSVEALGAAVSVDITYRTRSLASGDTSTFVARAYDHHGWEIPAFTRFTWTSSNPESCGVWDLQNPSTDGNRSVMKGYGGSGAFITATAESEDDTPLSRSVFCSVNGGQEY